MAIFERVKKHWITVGMYIVFSLFFLSACIVSANTYGGVAQAQRDIVLESPVESADIVPHGDVNVSFSIQLHNPSRYTLHVYTLSWYAKLVNASSTSDRVIPVGEDYSGPTHYLEVPARTTLTYTFWNVVSDPETMEKLNGFINYSKSLGTDYTLETLPYEHSFSIIAMIGDFQHDYVREGYLNDLVTVELGYSTQEGIR
ncbi:MAG: hypothetical protein MUC90_07110 [Thermoplasmata archaeon]|jgi:hypothetical protein|nr:hypothetical protein [Thermoplasmata archaeon]